MGALRLFRDYRGRGPGGLQDGATGNLKAGPLQDGATGGRRLQDGTTGTGGRTAPGLPLLMVAGPAKPLDEKAPDLGANQAGPAHA